MKNKVYWSKSVKWISSLVLPLILFAYTLSMPEDSWWSFFPLGILLLVCFCCAYWAPNYVEVTERAIRLHKLVGIKTIPLDEIKTIDLYRGGSMDVRVCGSGGFLGFTGLFYNNEIGNYYSYIGCYRQAFLIQLKNNKKYLLSCENREQLVAQVKSKIERI